MSLARPWWLAGLALLLPLILLHLRRPALAVREVASLMVWERLAASAQSADWRLRRPRNPLLLALQAIALCALVLALAGPQWQTSAPPRTTVYVVDGSLWMRVGSRLAQARSEVARLSAADPKARVAIVDATATPSVVYRGEARGVDGARGLRAGAGAGDLAPAIALGAGLLGGPQGRMVVLHAPEDQIPLLTTARGQVATEVIGKPTADQGLFARGARCGIGPADACEVVATVRNEGAAPSVDRYSAYSDGRRALTLRVRVPAHGASTIVLTALPGSTVRLQLTRPDALPLDDSASFSVPNAGGIPEGLTITLVGDPATAKPLAQALSAAPGVKLRLRTAASYRRQDAVDSDLVVLDGFLPRTGLPPAPAVVLVAPPRLPGGRIDGFISAPTVSGTAPDDDLLSDVDLSSLSIDRGAAERLELPAWLAPIVWSPAGALLAAGDDGRQRVAVLAFDPPRSNLTQLAALPILARNLERWASGWSSIGDDGSLAIDALPGTTRASVKGSSGGTRSFVLAGAPAGITGLAQGAYGISATGPGVAHSATVVAALPAPVQATTGGGAIDLESWASAAVPHSRDSLTPALILLALAAMAGDWVVWRRVRR